MTSPRKATVTFDVNLSGYTGSSLVFTGKVWNNGCVTSGIKYTTDISKCQQLKYTMFFLV